ncbi:uncharacterized protein LOC111325768 isoform X1 [Stylophora pistillata]|uniref:uncharacterized protein LOC111325768 isoform X1 n=2 Tax=Stylophora pistillata TaxID=50429 RepID=UPI000C03A748|nr:uncharacterized protein LOC111325768 isoform X1 [Stylophora pistillata]
MTQTSSHWLISLLHFLRFGAFGEVQVTFYTTMGAPESKPARVPRTLHVYVTNQTEGVEQIFIRVQGDKLTEREIYNHIVGLKAQGQGDQSGGRVGQNHHDKHMKGAREWRTYNNSPQGGFIYLPHRETMPFPAENDGHIMFVSVHDGNKVWSTNMPVDPTNYGCITIKGDRKGISVSPSNPKPRWIKFKERAPSFPRADLVEVNRGPDENPVYFGTIWKNNIIDEICEVSKTDIKKNNYYQWSGFPSLLSATGYEWVKVQRGNLIPVNAVSVSVGDGFRRVFLGHVNGDRACGITDVDRMLDQFVSLNDNSKMNNIATSGEVLLLTAEPMS